MEGRGDFIQSLGQDMTIKILGCMDPSDLVRISAVSRSWRRFVIANKLCKHLCLRIVPEISRFSNVIEIRDTTKPAKTDREEDKEWAYLEREHIAYASLYHCLASISGKNCILDAICASSTDNYPEESIKNTLEPSDRLDGRASYWSSRGQLSPAVDETLIYELAAKLCWITEVHVHPFQVWFPHLFFESWEISNGSS